MKKNDISFFEKLIVKVDSNNDWNYYELENGYILYKGLLVSWKKTLADITEILSSNDFKSEITDLLKRTFGHFSLIIKSNDLLLAAVDSTRSKPLYYMDNERVRFVTDNYRYFKDYFDDGLMLSSNSETEIHMSGYCSFQDTLYKDIKSFLPGQIFCFHPESGFLEANINDYQAWLVKSNLPQEQLLSKLNSKLINVMINVIKVLNGRQVVIPLSGGYDSRIIASILKKLGYDNVVCFTYGMHNNSEALIAKKVAQKLKYRWIFVEMNIKEQRAFYKSSDFVKYESYVDTIDAVPYYQGMYAVKYLKDKKLIDDDAVFINGNGGDFITGGHSDIYSTEYGKRELNSRIINTIINKHYSLWGNLKTKKNKELVGNKLTKEYEALSKFNSENLEVCDFFYYYEFVSRQSKYVIQGQKVFEFYGYEWMTPLWDPNLVEFWSSIPYKYKYDQFLYKDTIKYYNYSNVWSDDFLVNKHKVSPFILRYIRYIAKILVLLLSCGSRKAWERVDRTIFLYFYDITRMMCSVSYFKVLASMFKRPRHSVSFDVLRYISVYNKK